MGEPSGGPQPTPSHAAAYSFNRGNATWKRSASSVEITSPTSRTRHLRRDSLLGSCRSLHARWNIPREDSAPTIALEIISIYEREVQPPLHVTLAARSSSELFEGVRDALELTSLPQLFYLSGVSNELIEVNDIQYLPLRPKICVVQHTRSPKQIAELLHSLMDTRDRRHYLQTFSKCFYGHELVDCLLKHNLSAFPNRPSALQLAERLFQLGFVLPIEEKTFRDKAVYYRFSEERAGPQAPDKELLLSSRRSVFLWGGSSASYTPQELTLPMSDVGAMAQVEMVSCGTAHILALCDKGRVYSWGKGEAGQLGHAMTMSSSEPLLVQLLASSHFKAVYAGYDQSTAVSSEDELYVWGSQKRTPHDTTHSIAMPKRHALPIPADHIAHIQHLALGDTHAAVLVHQVVPGDESTFRSAIYTWGGNMRGQLGVGFTSLESLDPLPVAFPEERAALIKVACGEDFCAALTSSGQVWAWGQNKNRRLGTSSKKDSVPQPQPVKGLKRASQHLSCGRDFLVVLNDQDQMFCWGDPSALVGVHATSPKKLPLAKDVRAFTCGTDHIIIHTSPAHKDQIVLAGINVYGQLGVSRDVATHTTTGLLLDIPADKVLGVVAGGHYSAAIIVEDAKKVIKAAARKSLFTLDDNEKRKIFAIIHSDPSGSIQNAVRAALRAEKRSGPGRKGTLTELPEQVAMSFRSPVGSAPTTWAGSMIPESASMSTRQGEGGSYTGGSPGGSGRSTAGSVYQVAMSKYSLFQVTGEVPSFKFFKDSVALTNEDRKSDCQYYIKLPTSERFRITCPQATGTLRRGERLTVDFQAIALSSGHYEDLVAIEFRVGEQTYNQFLSVSLKCQVMLRVKEIPFNQLQGGQPLGSGAAGVVSLLRLRDGQEAAVKIFRVNEFSEEEVDSFRNEIMISSNLCHPNIVECLGVCMQYPNLALVLEYLPLKDLRHLIQRAEDEPALLPPELALRIAIDVAEGMLYLHSQMVMHRDLKPDNILLHSLDAVGTKVVAKVTDFGTSRVVSHAASEATEVGTTRYMPLEVLDPPKFGGALVPYDSRKSDVYSFGLVMHEMFSKEPPFLGCSFVGAIVETLKKDVPFLAFKREWGMPEDLCALIGQCVAQRPHTRPSFDEIHETLITVASHYPKLSDLVMRKRQQFEYTALPESASQLAHLQIDSLCQKRDALETREADLVAQQRALEAQIHSVQAERQALEEQIRALRAHEGEPLADPPAFLPPLPSPSPPASPLRPGSVELAPSSLRVQSMDMAMEVTVCPSPPEEDREAHTTGDADGDRDGDGGDGDGQPPDHASPALEDLLEGTHQEKGTDQSL